MGEPPRHFHLQPTHLADMDYQLSRITQARGERVTFITLVEAADQSGLHPEMVEEFLRGRLVTAFCNEAGEVLFDQNGVFRLRQIAHFRLQKHTDLKTLRFITSLLDALEARELENRRLRELLR